MPDVLGVKYGMKAISGIRPEATKAGIAESRAAWKRIEAAQNDLSPLHNILNSMLPPEEIILGYFPAGSALF